MTWRPSAHPCGLRGHQMAEPSSSRCSQVPPQGRVPGEPREAGCLGDAGPRPLHIFNFQDERSPSGRGPSARTSEPSPAPMSHCLRQPGSGVQPQAAAWGAGVPTGTTSSPGPPRPRDRRDQVQQQEGWRGAETLSVGSGPKGRTPLPSPADWFWGFCLGLPIGQMGVKGIISGK